ncbi:MAG: hypothetical protein ACREKH_00090, partial [Candidatus Rokuibacteriota bacterium]
MRLERVTKLAQALLYEGFLLYPYRASSVKNQQRWTFGTLYPRSFAEAQDEADPWWMRTECLVQGGEDTELEVCVRFLHLLEPEAHERQIETPTRAFGQLKEVSKSEVFELNLGEETSSTRARVEVGVEQIGDSLFKVIVHVCNLSPFVMRPADSRETRRQAALRCALASTHAILAVRGGTFVSLVDPPAPLREVAARCENVGVWPVLVG